MSWRTLKMLSSTGDDANNGLSNAPFEIQPVGGISAEFADLNGPRPGARFPSPSHFSWARVNVGWDWV